MNKIKRAKSGPKKKGRIKQRTTTIIKQKQTGASAGKRKKTEHNAVSQSNKSTKKGEPENTRQAGS